MPLATQHYPMLERNLLYTGVTRGKGLVVLIGQEKRRDNCEEKTMTCALRQRLVFGMWHATRQPTSLAHPMVARGEDDGHLAAAGVFQGAFCGLRSGRASAQMAFEFPRDSPRSSAGSRSA
jgi:hypothetical protein